jgi:phospholipase/carboxylesterase
MRPSIIFQTLGFLKTMKMLIRTIVLSLGMLMLMAPMPQEKKATLLHYVFKAPGKAVEKPPLVILLHGIGSNENDLFGLASQLPDNFLVVSARAPYHYGMDGYSWFDVDFSGVTPVINQQQELKSRGSILKFIEELKALHSFDASQVYLCGFSQGAIMSYGVGLTEAAKIKGIAVLGGRMLEEVKAQVKLNPALSRLKVLIYHGTNDKVIQVERAREANNYLKGMGIAAEYKEFPAGHEISKAMVMGLNEWLRR